MQKSLLTGNEAIARGAYEHGVGVATAYPGTPSTEILETIAQYEEISSQWAPNEKVALEVALGAAIGGTRALAAMKHVGVNVAADPLFTATYIGIKAGLVLISADDPGMHSSQNEQDNRIYAQFAKIGLLEPSNSQEAKDMVGQALTISENFDTPVMLRTTTRISHSKSLVELADPQAPISKAYVKNAGKYVAVPANARVRALTKEEGWPALTEFSEETPLNYIEWGNKDIGIVTSGVCYQYVKEAIPQASICKLGFTNPLPLKKIAAFASAVKELWVVEELEPFMETQIRAAGIPVQGGKDQLTRVGEYSPSLLRKVILGENLQYEEPLPVPVRPPVLCPGCPHRGVFYALKRNRKTVSGDIGCYALGASPPLGAVDTVICMGASIPVALGMELAHPEQAEEMVAVIGDSTFLHSGITGLINTVYNQGNSTVIILDNSTTAMTGHQDHAATGKTLRGQATARVDFEALCRAIGVKRIRVVDPNKLSALDRAIKEETAAKEPSVIIAQAPCALIVKQTEPAYTVDIEACTGCRICMGLGCPAISFDEGLRKSFIDPTLCVGCGLCQQVCKFGAIFQKEDQ